MPTHTRQKTQSQADRERRLKRGACPIHGVGMVPHVYVATPAQGEPYSLVECSRRDCGVQAKEYGDLEDPDGLRYELLPEWHYLLKDVQ